MTEPPGPIEDRLSQPFRLSRICVEKVWGGRALERVLGIELEAEGPIGETWELVDREDHNSVVGSGRFEGQSLHWLMTNRREELLGDAAPSATDRFPLLVKFISATQPLSVQVHPDECVAGKLGEGEEGKTEAWFVLDAEPDSLIYLGLRPEVDASEFAAGAGNADVVDLLESWKAKPGQFYFVPAGTVHAIGAGVTLLEVQQNSDATFRVFDWGRVGLNGEPRETHVEQALLAARYDLDSSGPRVPELEKLEGGSRGAVMVDGDPFRVELIEVCGVVHRKGTRRPVVLVCIAGGGTIARKGDEPEEFSCGDTWVVPAAAGDWNCESKGGECRIVLMEPEASR